MAWDFETDPEYQEQLDWAREFVDAEVRPVDLLVETPYDVADPVRQALFPPLQERVRERGLWATHLGTELGGPGHGQLKLALLNEVLGRSKCAPSIFGCQAPDTGNGEILAHFGTEEQKQRYLGPLLRNDVVSSFSMTEPHGGSDPTAFKTRAEWDGQAWVLNGEKWFISNARFAAFQIVMAVTDPEAPPRERMSAFLLPSDTPGIRFLRHVELADEAPGAGTEGYISYEDVRLPADSMLGERGGGFEVAQYRLGGGRIHHAMRSVGLMDYVIETMLERAASRTTKGEALGRKQLVQEMIADSWAQLEQFRLLVLRTAWRIDKHQEYRAVRGDISAVKAVMPKVVLDIVSRAIQLHGSLGLTRDMPFFDMLVTGFTMGLADGPTEIHKLVVARELLKEIEPIDDLFPTEHIPRRQIEAERLYGQVVEQLADANRS
jgi:acyl-CoA dehydrogenase